MGRSRGKKLDKAANDHGNVNVWQNYASADGGRPWPEYVKQYYGLSLFDYAWQGAVCSIDIIPRIVGGINNPSWGIKEGEIPAYLNDTQYTEPDGIRFEPDPAEKTVYAFWIGVNDVGVGAFLTDSQAGNNTLVNYTDCVYDQMQRVYDNGGRYFVLFNLPPLQLAPLYALPDQGGVGPCRFWPDKPDNLTAISYRMLEQVATVDSIFDYRTPYAVQIQKRYPGSHFAVFNVNGLMTDIYNNPTQYLNGSAPLNVTGYVHHCDTSGEDCTTLSDPDSFMWYDELHPSEQAARVVAAAFVDVLKGISPWAQYWAG
ncbi:hypothetical protein BT93_L4474 [Corymbia citriodora subsp. variegata]|uniref:Carbohydrate esterase family 16 protein n=1 Tax=Corymbia citriodora subsp. variegata TaxID=360336 RepID=A0A8T0CJV4_CORYI|nr:hypothetical protein BT93_L4474 [Corymbia citriodora subsp. variegata]